MYSSLLIGKVAEVVQSSDKSLLGRSGVIIDESKNMIHLCTEVGKTLRLPKSIVTLKLGSRIDSVFLEGSKIIGTPVDRIRG